MTSKSDDWPAVNTAALVCGIFDLPHLGHFRLLERAARMGPVVVGLLTDELATEYKRRPVLTYWERKATLEMLPWVSLVVQKKTHDARDVIRQVKPAYVVCGSDWSQEAFYELNNLTAEWMEHQEAGFVVLPSDRHLTTTGILERI